MLTILGVVMMSATAAVAPNIMAALMLCVSICLAASEALSIAILVPYKDALISQIALCFEFTPLFIVFICGCD